MWPAEDDYASSAPPLPPSRQWLDKIFENYGERDITCNLAGQIFDIEPTPIGMGSTSDVFRAKSSKHNELVAVKRIRLFLLDNVDFAKDLSREVRIWSKLNHPNVLPLSGYFLDGPKGIPNLISKWMKNGTVVDYAKGKKFQAGRNDKTLCRIVREMALGLDYLHETKGILHADLKGSNIFMSDDESPLLADFGLAVSSSSGSLGQSTHHGSKGTLRWMAKELHRSFGGLDSVECPSHTKMTDMWSFGMVIHEIIALESPYSDIKSDLLVSKAIVAGQLPEPVFSCLRYFPFNLITRGAYSIAYECWRDDPRKRPSAGRIAIMLGHYEPPPSFDIGDLIERTLARDIIKTIKTVNFLPFENEMGHPISLLHEPGVEEFAMFDDDDDDDVLDIVSLFGVSGG